MQSGRKINGSHGNGLKILLNGKWVKVYLDYCRIHGGNSICNTALIQFALLHTEVIIK